MINYVKTYKIKIITSGVFVAAGTNLVGKFTQSVRRIVQDVKDEGTASEYKELLY